MKKNKNTLKRSVYRSKKRSLSFWRHLRRLPSFAQVGLGIFVVLVGMAVLNFNLTEDPNATAQTPVAIKKFTTSYAGYNTGTSWISSLSMDKRCSKTLTVYGARPVASGNYPVLVYLHGTTADANSNKEGQRFIELAAAQGFVAFAPTYKSGGSLNEKGLQRHAHCLFNQSHPKDMMTAVCATSGTDCSKGVLLAGFSQGGSIATIAKNYNSKIKAVWAIGVSAYIYPSKKIPSDAFAPPYGTRTLANDNLVINMGQSSNTAKRSLIPEDLPSLKKFTGVDCGSNYNCLQADGSGYYIVQNSEIKDKVADHCYWLMVNKWSTGLSCTTAPKELDPGFQPPSTSTWSMIRNLNWLRSHI